VALVPRAGLVGGAIGAAVLLPAGLATAWWTRREVRRIVQAFPPRSGFDAGTARTLSRVGLAALALALADQGTLLALRSHYLRVNGLSANGLLQAALALSLQASGVFQAYLANYAFGRVSAAAGPEGVRDYTRRQWAPFVSLATLAFAVAMLIAGPLLRILYSDQFAPARPLMAWVLLAEFCRVMTQTWGIGALPAGGLRAWVPIGIAGPLVFIPAYLLLAPVAGVLALPWASAISALIQLVITGVLMGRLGVTLRARDLALLAAALAGLGLLARAVARG